MPLCEYRAFIADWKLEDRANAYRYAELTAQVMNSHPYRKKAVTAAELLGDGDAAPRKGGGGLGMLRLVLESIASEKQRKGAANGT